MVAPLIERSPIPNGIKLGSSGHDAAALPLAPPPLSSHCNLLRRCSCCVVRASISRVSQKPKQKTSQRFNETWLNICYLLYQLTHLSLSFVQLFLSLSFDALGSLFLSFSSLLLYLFVFLFSVSYFLILIFRFLSDLIFSFLSSLTFYSHAIFVFASTVFQSLSQYFTFSFFFFFFLFPAFSHKY